MRGRLGRKRSSESIETIWEKIGGVCDADSADLSDFDERDRAW